MKRVLTGILSMAMVVGLVGCGTPAASSSQAASSSATETPAATSSQAPAASAATQTDFPKGDITLICPFGAGGGTDALARKMAEIVKTQSGIDMLVVNKTGGSGAVGMGEGSMAKADGYTVTMTTVESVLLPLAGLATFKTEDFKPIVRINVDPAALIVRADSSYNSIQDVVDAAKTSPKSWALMVSAFPTNYWLCGAMLGEKAGAEFNLIPAQGGAADQIQALLGKHVEGIIVTAAEAASYVESGEFRILGIAGNEKNPMFPEVPLFKEEGFEIEVGTWRGLMVPKDTPDEVVAKLSEVFTAAAQSPEMKEFLEKMGFGEGYLDSAAFAALVTAQSEQYAPIISQYK